MRTCVIRSVKVHRSQIQSHSWIFSEYFVVICINTGLLQFGKDAYWYVNDSCSPWTPSTPIRSLVHQIIIISLLDYCLTPYQRLRLYNGLVHQKAFNKPLFSSCLRIHKRDDFNFNITNFPFLSSNIPSSPAYGVLSHSSFPGLCPLMNVLF